MYSCFLVARFLHQFGSATDRLIYDTLHLFYLSNTFPYTYMLDTTQKLQKSAHFHEFVSIYPWWQCFLAMMSPAQPKYPLFLRLVSSRATAWIEYVASSNNNVTET